jgi:hypothetical protein
MSIGYTPYSLTNREFSERAHQCARANIYPEIFGVKNTLTFEDLPEDQAMTLDGDMGIDRHVRVHVQGLHAPFSVLVQERFRRPQFARFQDVTVTEWNHNSNLPGELYKIKAEMFLYGYHNPSTDSFLEAIAFSVFLLKIKIAQGTIQYTSSPNHRTNQTFLGFKFDDLKDCTTFRKRWNIPASAK